MPIMGADMEQKTAGNFQFSAVRPEKLGATEYTVACLVVDKTGSVQEFRDLIAKMIGEIVMSLQQSPRANNLLLRVILFDTDIEEVHGFTLLGDLDIDKYDKVYPQRPWGRTALYEACCNAIESIVAYSEELFENGFEVNGYLGVITDGMDNESERKGITTVSVKEATTKAMQSEMLESLMSILVGVNLTEPMAADYLDKFQKEAELTQFTDAGSADAKTFSKIAGFISSSAVSQSQSIGSGAASQPLSI